MADKLHGFPFWVLSFDRKGTPDDAGAIDQFIGELSAEKVSDLFVFSHGWNNDRTEALSLYNRFFKEVRTILDDGRFPKTNPGARVGVAGVIWPSILWPDDAESSAMETVVGGGGAAAGFGGGPQKAAAPATPQQIKAELRKGYEDARQLALIDDLTEMLKKQTGTEAALKEFQKKLAEFIDTEGTLDDKQQPDSAEGALGQLEDKQWRGLLETLGAQALQGQGGPGGGVGIGDPFKKLWAGAKDALRLATYWQMKERAGTVGHKGLGAVLTKVTESAKTIRIHLLGHSFGARLVSFALQGLPDTLSGEKSPVKSLFLLQGAFSHWAFADKLPHDNTRSGALRGMASRVDGPLLTTHSLKDLAVGRSYPAASFANRDDAAAAGDDVSRWGAMGHDGAQAVQAAAERLSAPGKKYSFRKGEWLNLDGNTVIIHGGRPSGAHSDIVHPHTAWAALAAGGLV